MNPSPEARALMHENRQLFTERRRARRFWNRWWPLIAGCLIALLYLITKGIV